MRDKLCDVCNYLWWPKKVQESLEIPRRNQNYSRNDFIETKEWVLVKINSSFRWSFLMVLVWCLELDWTRLPELFVTVLLNSHDQLVCGSAWWLQFMHDVSIDYLKFCTKHLTILTREHPMGQFLLLQAVPSDKVSSLLQRAEFVFYTRNYLGKLLGHPGPPLRILWTHLRIQGVSISWLMLGTSYLGESQALAEVLTWRTTVIVMCFAVKSIRVSVNHLSNWSIV